MFVSIRSHPSAEWRMELADPHDPGLPAMPDQDSCSVDSGCFDRICSPVLSRGGRGLFFQGWPSP